MNGCMLPGRMICCSGAVRFGATAATDGTAICAVTVPRADAAFTRDLIPVAKTKITANPTAATTSQRQFRRLVLFGFVGVTNSICPGTSVCFISLFISLTNALVQWLTFERYGFACRTMQHAEESRNKEQRGYRREQQAPDHGPSQRSVLLAAVSHSQRHRNHSDNHGQSGHQHGTKTCEPRLQRGCNRIFACRHLLRGEAHHQD